MQKIGVIGAGAWGTALAIAAKRAGRDVTIWAHEPEVVSAINDKHENTTFLSGIKLDSGIKATSNMAEALNADAVLMVAPAQHVRGVCEMAKPHWKKGAPIVLCSKGVEKNTLNLMSEIAEQVLGDTAPVAVLSGPTFAKEVANNLPTAITLACRDEALGQKLIDAMASKTFRPYYSPDVIGAELGGAIKNVLAIACGIVEGRKMGDNARAALITRGLAEIARLGLVLGAEPLTLMGLSGLGDLTLTCNAMQSRNFSLGFELGQGKSLDEILSERNSVAEGVPSATSVVELAEKNQVDMPICQAVYAVLNVEADLDSIILGLLSRPLNVE